MSKKSVRYCPSCKIYRKFQYEYSIKHSTCIACGFHGKEAKHADPLILLQIINNLKQVNEGLKREVDRLRKKIKGGLIHD